MSKFKGKNTLKSPIELMYYRHLYDTTAFPENGGLGPPQIVDFNFAERNLYGKVDRQLNPVYAKEQYLAPVVNSNNRNNTIRAMDFVCHQFNDFESHYFRACRMGLIPIEDALLSTIEIKKAYVDPLNLYHTYAAELMSLYNSTFLIERKRQIITFHDYLAAFPQFMERMKSIYPITFSGYQRSSQSSIFSSGLALDIGGLPFDDDELKEDLLLNNTAFQFYINLAKQYGFSVNKKNPSVLISDLQGPATIVYLALYDLSSVDMIFTRSYEKTLYSDMTELTKLFINYYNSFVSMYPIETYPNSCGNKTTTTVTNREYIIANNIDNNTKDIILYLYINIRNIEERKPFSSSEISYIHQNALRLKKITETRGLSRFMMIDYIDDQFKSKYNYKMGNLTYHKKKLEKKLDK
tara:strand:- start:1049 stop:2275 length:1227 start_codon:yes stop_codon:yes gene_type:complete